MKSNILYFYFVVYFQFFFGEIFGFMNVNHYRKTQVLFRPLYVAQLRSMIGVPDKKIPTQMSYDDIEQVIIESPSANSRKITSSILIDGSVDDVWRTLTDYDNLATYIPNLVKSYTVKKTPNSVQIFQEGAQKIFGFDFRASLTMEMNEKQYYEDEKSVQKLENLGLTKLKRLGFKLVESSMFASFDGEWIIKTHSRTRHIDNQRNEYFTYKSKLTYSVYIRPRGVVPVLALEWRIKDDVPLNLAAMKIAVEKNKLLYGNLKTNNNQNNNNFRGSFPMNWENDETLGAYIFEK